MSDVDRSAEFRARIAALEFNQSSLSRAMHDLGDPRSVPTILRSVSNWCRGEAPVPGEMWALLRSLELQRAGVMEDSAA